MTLPNFIVIGAAKAGTTSLYQYLNQHPQIYMSPVKEPRYFAPEYYTTYFKRSYRNEGRRPAMSLQEYKSLFQDVVEETAIGEASTEYLTIPESAKRIKQLIPNAKIIAVLRNPAERAFSAYCYHVRDGRETLSFEEALKQEWRRKEEGWQIGWLYREGGFYYRGLREYYRCFNRDRIKVLLWEDLKFDTEATCQNVFNFLGIEHLPIHNLCEFNKSSVPRSRAINRFILKNQRLHRVVNCYVHKSAYESFSSLLKQIFYFEKQEMSRAVKKKLSRSYYQDISNLEKLLDKDLSMWKTI